MEGKVNVIADLFLFSHNCKYFLREVFGMTVEYTYPFKISVPGEVFEKIAEISFAGQIIAIGRGVLGYEIDLFNSALGKHLSFGDD